MTAEGYLLVLLQGYVGVSDVCVMGLNQNRGQKIFLRLRTDDLKVRTTVSLPHQVEVVYILLVIGGRGWLSLLSPCAARDQGFRKMLSIRKVLYHELSHMENDEHDDKFYILMREIERDVNAYNQAGRALGGAARYGSARVA